MKKRNEWKPILFDGQMISAIANGRKNVTRRLQGIPTISMDEDGNLFVACKKWYGYEEMSKANIIEEFCPYHVGQKLWVKETFIIEENCIWYRADCDNGPPNEVCEHLNGNEVETSRWKPSLFMPRNISRIDLLVTEIGLGQLGDMRQEDFVREGFNNKDELVALWNRKNPKNPYDDYKFVWDVGFSVLEIRS